MQSNGGEKAVDAAHDAAVFIYEEILLKQKRQCDSMEGVSDQEPGIFQLLGINVAYGDDGMAQLAQHLLVQSCNIAVTDNRGSHSVLLICSRKYLPYLLQRRPRNPS